MISPYAKFYITLVGVAITSALALIPPTTPLWIVLTILSGLVTAALTYRVPNAPLPGGNGPTDLDPLDSYYGSIGASDAVLRDRSAPLPAIVKPPTPRGVPDSDDGIGRVEYTDQNDPENPAA